MPSFVAWMPHSAAQGWLFLPLAVLLGALHGLEPGHSKTMMAAFIIAIRGTVAQAVLLGLSAAISHTALVWIVALGGKYFWSGSSAASSEPYFQIASGLAVAAIAAWMMWRTWHGQHGGQHHAHAHAHNAQAGGHTHHHSHDHPRDHGHSHDHNHGTPGHHHHHDDDKSQAAWQDLMSQTETADAHERAHAAEIARRFASQNASGQAAPAHVTTGQIIVFGLFGGLIPCPAAITVLLLCLQMKAFVLAVVLVLCFSVGVAATMVAAGVLAALSLKHIRTRYSGLFDAFARRAPYASGALMMLVALYMGLSGWLSLSGGHLA